MNILDGYKTYLLVLAASLLWLGIVFNIWTMDQIQNLLVILGILGVGAMRSAIDKINQ